MAYTDIEIRGALRDVIALSAPLAVVFPWWVLEGPRIDWTGKLASDADMGPDGLPRVHAYMITRVNSDGEVRALNCVRRIYTYEIRAYHYYDTGNQDGNSDYTFNLELDAITASLDDTLTIADLLPDQVVILGNRNDDSPPMIWEIHLDPFGDKSVHFAIGRIQIIAGN